jgi:hypothetical protein
LWWHSKDEPRFFEFQSNPLIVCAQFLEFEVIAFKFRLHFSWRFLHQPNPLPQIFAKACLHRHNG